LGHLAGRYVRALRSEAELAAPRWGDVRFVSMFVGGGTPTTVPPAELVDLIESLRRAFPFEPGAEVTVEANPDTVDRGSLTALRRAGVTRLSMGAQSFDPAVLRALQRDHDPASVLEAF